MTFANISLSDPVEYGKLARSEGKIEIGFHQKSGLSRLQHLYQSGCGRVWFPSVDHEIPEAVLINTSGGLTGGDVMAYDVVVGKNARLTVTGQAAEKIYKSIGPDVEIETSLSVEEGGYLEWLPQETILFEKGRLKRLNLVKLATDSVFLALEATVLGRRAHGEILTEARLKDGWKIWRGGKLIWFDQFSLDGPMDHYLARPTILDGATAFATIVLVVPDPAPYLQSVRDVADQCESRVGATSFDDGLIVVRVMDPEAYSLRKSLVTIINHLRKKLAKSAVPMPAVWEV